MTPRIGQTVRACLLGVVGTLFFLSVGGCSLWSKREAIAALKDLAREKEAQKRWVAEAEKRFERLRDDVRAERLTTGLSSAAILERYGEPVLRRCPDERTGAACMWLYRHPVRYFDSDKVYLYFDGGRKLSRVVFVPHEQMRAPSTEDEQPDSHGGPGGRRAR